MVRLHANRLACEYRTTCTTTITTNIVRPMNWQIWAKLVSVVRSAWEVDDEDAPLIRFTRTIRRKNEHM